MEKEDILEKVYETAKRYELKSGGCAQCTIAAIFDVLNLYDPEEIKAAFEAGMPEKCSTLVGKTARMAARIILDAREAKKGKPDQLPIL